MSTHALARPATSPVSRRRKAAASPPAARLPGIPFLDVDEIPDLYAMVLRGDCLSPELNDGDEVQFSKHEPPKAGDFCIFILKPELVTPGGLQCAIKRLALAIPPHVTFPWTEHPKSDVHAIVIAEQINPRRQYMIRCDQLLAVHKFVGVQKEVAR